MTNPGNIVRIRSRKGGRASVYEANMWAQKWQTGLFSGIGVIQNTSPDLNVLVGGSTAKPDVIIGQNAAGYNIALDLIGSQALAITKPVTNSRISSIVAYTDDLSLVSSDAATTGSPSSCGLIVVNGATSASPVAPSDSDIRSAITADGATGSQATYCVIATILVASSTTTITNSLITIRKSLLTSDKMDGATFPRFRGVTSTSGIIGVVNITSYTEIYDIGGNFASGVFTVPVGYPGTYLFTSGIGATNIVGRLELYLILNGNVIASNWTRSGASVDDPSCSVSTEIDLVAGDQVSLRCISPDTTAALDPGRSYFTGSLRFRS